MNQSASSSKKTSKHSLRLGVAANLIARYLELPEDLQESFEKVLALQIYGTDGMHLYLPSGDSWAALQSAMSKHWVVELLVESWFDWALTIRSADLNDFERRAAVRAMLGALIQQKDRRGLSDRELRKAAKRTLGWTHWDEMRSGD